MELIKQRCPSRRDFQRLEVIESCFSIMLHAEIKDLHWRFEALPSKFSGIGIPPAILCCRAGAVQSAALSKHT